MGQAKRGTLGRVLSGAMARPSMVGDSWRSWLILEIVVSYFCDCSFTIVAQDVHGESIVADSTISEHVC